MLLICASSCPSNVCICATRPGCISEPYDSRVWRYDAGAVASDAGDSDDAGVLSGGDAAFDEQLLEDLRIRDMDRVRLSAVLEALVATIRVRPLKIESSSCSSS